MSTSVNGAPADKSYFEQQRELLINDVASVSTVPPERGLSHID